MIQEHNKRNFWIIISIISIVVFFCGVYFLVNFLKVDVRDTASQIINNEEVKKVIHNVGLEKESDDNKICHNCEARRIDGVQVPVEVANIQPFAVVIDNHPDARDPFGLGKANIVYELEAEGGITRFLAVYSTDQVVEKIGPIRSARPYLIDIASEYEALFTHVGGSPQALAQIIKEGVLDINEFYKGEYFWRGKNKKAPHNVYTASNQLERYLESRGVGEANFLPWSFREGSKSLYDGVLAGHIAIEYMYDEYDIVWKYDNINNKYVRYSAGSITKSNGKELDTKNLVVQFVDTKVIDNEGRLEMDLVGQGEALVCFGGKCSQAKWRKTNKSSRTRFYNNENNEIKFLPGRVWINMVRPNYKVTF